jgi:steroid 5-alpha reductase family enzyme
VITHHWELLLIGLGLAEAIFLPLYALQLRTGDATAVDAGWAVTLALLAALYAALGPGCLAYRILVAVTGGLQFLRVGSVVLRRVGHGEDRRYRDLRTKWTARGGVRRRFFAFYQTQALLALGLSGPFLLACFDGHHGLQPVAWAGAALWLVAAGGEALADRQLRRFKADPANKGKTMRSGLWRYSRHPNYFFQWTSWIAYALIAVQAPWGWLGWISPAVMLYLIVFVTGIPPAEEQALRSRGEDYRRYQRETSAFVPWFPRSSR